LVQTLCSAISSGSELLIYRGQFPADLAVDENIPALQRQFGYPLKYGYSAVGRVSALGEKVDRAWEGKLVFAFNPHESHFVADPHALQPLPEGIDAQDAVFLPNMETAVNFIMDGRPLIGEKVIVIGQGIVGLLTTALLAKFPLGGLVSLDFFPKRREASLQMGADDSLDPDDELMQARLRQSFPEGADLVYELSGSPAGLNQAIASCGFEGRIVIGSWYGQKKASLDLGSRFHRSRIRLVSSQVSTLASELSGRWNKSRRFEIAWEMLRLIQPKRLISHSVSFIQASQAYQLLDEHPEQALQVILSYS
jgi:threonine dehydrogenase-like Zn-dependent dehydrogenase